MSKLATPPHVINSDMSQVIDDATSTMNDAYCRGVNTADVLV